MTTVEDCFCCSAGATDGAKWEAIRLSILISFICSWLVTESILANWKGSLDRSAFISFNRSSILLSAEKDSRNTPMNNLRRLRVPYVIYCTWGTVSLPNGNSALSSAVSVTQPHSSCQITAQTPKPYIKNRHNHMHFTSLQQHYGIPLSTLYIFKQMLVAIN